MDPLVSAVIALTAPGAVLLSLEARKLLGPNVPDPIFAGTRKALADVLPYSHPVAPDVVKLKDGSYLAAWNVAGEDVGGLSDDEIRKATLQTAAMMGLLPPRAGVGGISNLQLYLRPLRYREYEPGLALGRHPVLQLIDSLRATTFTETTAIYRTRRVISFTWQSPSATNEWFRRQASTGVAAQRKAEDVILRDFAALCTRIESSLTTRLLSVSRLGQHTEVDRHGVLQTRTDLIGFISSCVTGTDAPFNVPHPEVPLDELLAVPVVCGHEPMIGAKEVSVVHFTSWPAEAVPRILSKLSEAQVEHEFCIRFLPKTVAKARKNLKKAVYEFGGAAGSHQGFVDQDAQNSADQSVVAFGQAAGDYTRNGDVTYALVIRGDTREEVRSAELVVMGIVEDAGFRAAVRKDGALDTIFSTFPGMFKRGNRRPQFDAYTVAKTFDVHEPDLGARYSDAESYPPKTPPLTYALGPGNTPIRIHAHGKHDVGHALIAADTGNGKSVLFSLITASMNGRYPNTGVTSIDRGESSQQLCEILDGQYIRLLDDNAYAARGLEAPGFALFENCDDPEEAAEAQQILETILVLNGVPKSALRSKSIRIAIDKLGSIDGDLRSMLTFVDLLADNDHTMRDVFAKYTRDGVLGATLDRTRDAFNVSRVNAINIDKVMSRFEREPEYLIPILLTIVWKTVSKVRKMKAALGPRAGELHWHYNFDEFNNSLMKHPIGASIANDLFLLGRKENFTLWVASNSLTDLVNSSGFETIKQSCKTMLFGGDAAAMSPGRRVLYEAYGVPPQGIKMLSEMGDWEWLFFQPEKKIVRRVNFALDAPVRAVLGSSRTAPKVEQFKARFPVAEFGSWRWRSELIRDNGSPDAADRFDAIVSRWSANTR